MKVLARRCSIGLVVLVLALGFATGCQKDPYTASMAASLDVSNVVGDGITVLGELKKDGLITQDETVKFAGYLSSITTLNGTFRADVKQLHTSGATGKDVYIVAAQTFINNANDPTVLAAVHVTNPAAQAKVANVVKAIQTALDGIQTAINSASGGA